MVSFPQVSPPKPCIHLSSPIRATCPAHLILDFLTRTIFVDEYGSLRSSLYSFLHSPITLTLLGPNIHNTLFSNTLSQRYSFNVSDQVAHPYKTTGKITILYILIFVLLDRKPSTRVIFINIVCTCVRACVCVCMYVWMHLRTHVWTSFIQLFELLTAVCVQLRTCRLWCNQRRVIFKQSQCFGATCCFRVRYRKCMYLRSSKPKNAVTGSSEPLLLAHQTTRYISEECNVHGRIATRLYGFRMHICSCCFHTATGKQTACLWLSSFVSFQMSFPFAGSFLWRKHVVQIAVFVYLIIIHNTFHSELMSCMGYDTLCYTGAKTTLRSFIQCLI